jgi:exonuclease SbcD
MKFAHLADCHLGGWAQQELRDLNFSSFQKAVNICIKEKVKFILIAGDLFDSPYPSIEILKKTFFEFRRIKESKIPVFLIPGSHDYSASGKTFLDVLETAGLAVNVARFSEHNNSIMLEPTIYENIAFYGYPGKRSGLEVEDLKRVILQQAPGLYKILMLHTTISDVAPNAMISSIDSSFLPEVDYVALGHVHTARIIKNKVYPGPIFPNNFTELEELKHGSFFIVENNLPRKIELKIKEVAIYNFEVKNTLKLTEQLISFLKNENLNEKIILLRLSGIIEQGKISDIDFDRIELFLKENKAFSFLKNTSKLHSTELELSNLSNHTYNLEEEILKKFEAENPTKFNHLIPTIMKALQIEKLEDERLVSYEERLMGESKKILNI